MPQEISPFYQRLRRTSRFGNTDFGQLEMPAQILDNVTQGIVNQRAQQIAQAKKNAEDMAINESLSRFSQLRRRGQSSSLFGAGNQNPEYDDIALNAGLRGGERGKMIADYIQKTRDRQDTAITPYEDFRKGYQNTPEGQKQAAADFLEKQKQQPVKKTVDRIVGKNGFFYDVIEDPSTGQTEYRKTNVEARPLASSGVDERQNKTLINKLEREKNALQTKIAQKYGNKLNLTAILNGEGQIPLVRKYKWDSVLGKYIEDDKGNLITEPDPQPDKDVLDWLSAITELETEYKNQGLNFVPAKQSRGGAKGTPNQQQTASKRGGGF